MSDKSFNLAISSVRFIRRVFMKILGNDIFFSFASQIRYLNVGINRVNNFCVSSGEEFSVSGDRSDLINQLISSRSRKIESCGRARGNRADTRVIGRRAVQSSFPSC